MYCSEMSIYRISYPLDPGRDCVSLCLTVNQATEKALAYTGYSSIVTDAGIYI